MNGTLFFFSGWACDKPLWQHHHLDEWPGWQSHLVVQPWTPPAPLSKFKAPVVLIGHSLGFLYAAAQWARPSDTLVAVNSMTCFVQKKDFPHGVSPTILAAMRARVQQEPHAALEDFFRLCLPTASTINKELFSICLVHARQMAVPSLLHGLTMLETLDVRALPLGKIFALAASEDKVVPRALATASFRHHAHLQWCNSDSHLLPLTHPELCRTFIAHALAQLGSSP